MDSYIEVECPVCNTRSVEYLCKYPGLFYNCHSIVKCNECSHVFVDEIPGEAELREYYNSGQYYDSSNNVFSREYTDFSYKLASSRIDLISQHSEILSKPIKILDVGAGNGIFGKAIKDKYCKIIYDVIEPDKSILKRHGNWVDSSFCDVLSSPHREYDLVVLNQVLEHIANPRRFLLSIIEKMAFGGYIYIDVPLNDYLFKPDVSPHLHFWNPDSVAALITEGKINIIYCDSAGMVRKQAEKYFAKKTLFAKLTSTWVHKNQINKFLSYIRSPYLINTFGQFQATQYGGDRQWLRCLARKIDN